MNQSSPRMVLEPEQQWTSAPLRLKREAWFPVQPPTLFISLSNPTKMCQIFSWMHDISIENDDGTQECRLGTVRRCHFGNGMVLEEVIVGWEAPCWYAYRGIDETHPFGMVGHVGIIECLPRNNGSTLIWRHFFEHSNPVAMTDQLNASVQMALDGLQAQFSHG